MPSLKSNSTLLALGVRHLHFLEHNDGKSLKKRVCPKSFLKRIITAANDVSSVFVSFSVSASAAISWKKIL